MSRFSVVLLPLVLATGAALAQGTEGLWAKTCAVCHGEEHTSATDVEKARIPTPETCALCHETQVEQFKRGKHAFGWAAMKAMPQANPRVMSAHSIWRP